jgi:ABC-2 type transport system permease protein
MKRLAFSPVRAAVIAGNTFREGVRQRLLPLLLAMAAASAGGALILRDFNFGSSELKFLTDAGFGALTLFGAVLGIVVTAQAFFDEIERRTVLAVLAKPVRRAEFIVGKLGGVLGLLLVFCGALTALLAGLLWWRETALMAADPEAFKAGRQVAYGSVALCGLVQWLKLGVTAALTLLVASQARSSVVAVLAGFFALAVGHLQYLARDFYAMADARWAGVGARMLGLIFPDFQVFNVTDRVAAGEALAGGVVCAIAAYAFAYLSAYAGLAIYCFRRREL